MESRRLLSGLDTDPALLAWLAFENGLDLGDDSSLAGNDASVNGNVIQGLLDPIRGSGYAVFDGNNDYLDFGDLNEIDSPSELTVAMWFRRMVDHAGGALDTNHGINNVLIAQSSNAANDNLEIGTEGGISNCTWIRAGRIVFRRRAGW